ncbi:unnamed protein product [Paramecium octaurelia]|uniref:Transmembrane protein n=1 Tax=Paramecium octaurelia TaxID=43137 RepID=A0A8S1URM0_PAROT|nr:unnamed protein product [Paramecium octaurelia]
MNMISCVKTKTTKKSYKKHNVSCRKQLQICCKTIVCSLKILFEKFQNKQVCCYYIITILSFLLMFQFFLNYSQLKKCIIKDKLSSKQSTSDIKQGFQNYQNNEALLNKDNFHKRINSDLRAA